MKSKMGRKITVSIMLSMDSESQPTESFRLDQISCEGDMNYKPFNTFSILSAYEFPIVVHTADD